MAWLKSALLMAFGLLVFQNSQWKLEFEKQGITVYTCRIEGFELKAFRGEMTIEATVDDLLPFILNVEDYPKWCYKTSSTKLIKKEGNRIFYYYLSETPPLVSDREGYFCSEIIKDSLTVSTFVTLKIVDSEEAVPKGMVRIPFSDGLWTFTPINAGSTKVSFQMHADPGGMIPAWLANLASVESPWVTLNNLRKLVIEQKAK